MAVFGVVSATVLAPTASALARVAFIAYSPSTGVAGGAWNYSTINGAIDRAEAECANHPIHPTDCPGFGGGATLPSRCVDLVIGSDKSQYAIKAGPTHDAAEQAALAAAADGSDSSNYAGQPIDGAHSVLHVCNGNGAPDQGQSGVFS